MDAKTDWNQPPEFAPRDLWTEDIALREAVLREGAQTFSGQIADYARLAGDTLYVLAGDAHRDRPRLCTHDRFGERIDLVQFHPAYHQLMQTAISHGVAGLSWQRPQPGAHVARAALCYLHNQAEPGTSCPLTMTHAAVPVLRHAPQLQMWIDGISACQYDPRELPANEKHGLTLGMGMTERQGGSDVRQNRTRASPTAIAGEYCLHGHKWFFSAPMSDGFVVLAQAKDGLSCFLLPRRLPDGTRNRFELLRLKDKLGDCSNASAEVEFDGALAWRMGEEGRGVATILKMVMLTRLDCMLGSAAQMRMALAQALHHCRHRQAFGKALIEQPLMGNVLADLAIESEAALTLAMRVARAVDATERDQQEAALARVATALGKYWICKRTPTFVNEAQECLGGAGYIEDSILPRLYRQAPLNSIWEGSGNIQCLDVLRALRREATTADALLAELEPARGLDEHFDLAFEAQRLLLKIPIYPEAGARQHVESLALLLQGALLLRSGSPMAGAFCYSRLGGAHGLAFGTLDAAGVNLAPLLQRASGL